MRLALITVVGCVASVGILTACSGSTESSQVTNQAATPQDADGTADDAGVMADADAGVVTILNGGGPDGMKFVPADVTIKVGTTVRWEWAGGERHNVVSGKVTGGAGRPDGKFCNPGRPTCGTDAPLKRAPYSFDYTFTSEGDFPYFCAPHVAMGHVGIVRVVP